MNGGICVSDLSWVAPFFSISIFVFDIKTGGTSGSTKPDIIAEIPLN
jgi:hypothetical protein